MARGAPLGLLRVERQEAPIKPGWPPGRVSRTILAAETLLEELRTAFRFHPLPAGRSVDSGTFRRSVVTGNGGNLFSGSPKAR